MRRIQKFHLQLCAKGVIVGILTGLVISAYRSILEYLAVLRTDLYALFTINNWPLFLVYLLLILFCAFLLCRLVASEPLISGSGIPQIKGILIGKIQMNWLRVLLCKFIGGFIAIGAGLSLGREGPSVQLGAAIGQGISEKSKAKETESKFLLISGACAGLAAAFNAPFAGIVFGIEELYKKTSPLLITAAALSSITSAAVTEIFFGQITIFHLGMMPLFPLNYFWLLCILGIFIAILSKSFNLALFKALAVFANCRFLQRIGKPTLPLLTAVVFGFLLPEVLGGGNQLVNSLGQVHDGIAFLCLLYLVKLLFTALSFGSGVPGGIFLPMLVLGAVSGDIFGQLVISLDSNMIFYSANFIALSMAAYFAAVVKSPLTGSILLLEMTGAVDSLLALFLVSAVAYITIDLLGGKPIYDLLLWRSLKSKK